MAFMNNALMNLYLRVKRALKPVFTLEAWVARNFNLIFEDTRLAR